MSQIDEVVPHGVFLSGPFTAGAHLARHLCQRAFSHAGVPVRVKHGGIRTRTVDLIAASEAVVACVGQQPPAIRDVFGRSLPEMELLLAATQLRLPGLAVLVGPDPRPPRDRSSDLQLVVEMRQLLRSFLGEAAVFDIPEFDEEDDADGAPTRQLLWALAVDHALAEAVDEALPEDFEERARRVLGDHGRKAARRGKGRRLLHRRVVEAGLRFPEAGYFDELVARFLAWSGDWKARARPILNDRVFLSYSRKDRSLARRVRARIEAAGFRVWMDESELRPGQRLETTIFPELERCGGMVVLMTPDSAASEWVPREARHGMSLQQRWGQERFFVLPLRARGLPVEAFDGVGMEAELPRLADLLHRELDFEDPAVDAQLDALFAAIPELRSDPRPR